MSNVVKLILFLCFSAVFPIKAPHQNNPNSILAIYNHFKGNKYLALEICRFLRLVATDDQESLNLKKNLMFYRALYGNFGLWARPLDLFYFAQYNIEGRSEYKFKAGTTYGNFSEEELTLVNQGKDLFMFKECSFYFNDENFNVVGIGRYSEKADLILVFHRNQKGILFATPIDDFYSDQFDKQNFENLLNCVKQLEKIILSEQL